jgi:hypothetical protein
METAEQVQAPAQRGDVQAASVATQADRPKSGYARLRLRHKALIQDYSTLRHDTEALLQAHAKLMSSRADHAPPWHQSASRILDLLELEPDLRSMQVFAAALAQLETRLTKVVAASGLMP